MAANLAAGGDANFYYEDMPLTQDIVPLARGIQYASGAGAINNVAATYDSAGWPTQDFGLLLHTSSRSPSWINGTFKCGYTSRGAGGETITATGTSSVANIVNNSGVVTFDLVVPSNSTTFGFTVTGGSGATDIFAYIPAYAANASQGHVDITTANVLAGKHIFTTEAINLFKQFRQIRVSCWPQNMWNCGGGIVVNFASNPGAGATSGTLVANSVPAGTYTCIFAPTPFQSTPDVRSVTFGSNGQTAISWTGGLTYAATAIWLPCSSTTRRTPQNTKGATLPVWANEEGFPLGYWLALSAACGNGLWLGLPVHDDGTYFPAALTELNNERVAGITYNIELGNELWNGSPAQQCFNALATNAGFPSSLLGSAQYYATRLHAIANEGRTLFGSDWNNKIRLVGAWQNGLSAFHQDMCAYMVSQGWSPSADLWCLSGAPYFIGYPGIVSTDSVAQIEAKVSTACTFPFVAGRSGTKMLIEHVIAVAYWYGLPGIFECYECDWDSVSDYNSSSNANIGATIMDSGLRPILRSAFQSLLDIGVKGITFFEVGDSSDTTAQSPRYEITNTYGSESSSPRLLAMQDVMNGAYTPSRNVVAASGTTQIDARNYLDNTPSINSAYPNFTTTSNVSPVNQYNWGLMIQVPSACTKTIKLYLTTAASGTLNAYLDGTQIASGVAISNGLSNSAVTMATSVALSAGHHYLEFGNGASLANITPSSYVEFD